MGADEATPLAENPIMYHLEMRNVTCPAGSFGYVEIQCYDYIIRILKIVCTLECEAQSNVLTTSHIQPRTKAIIRANYPAINVGAGLGGDITPFQCTAATVYAYCLEGDILIQDVRTRMCGLNVQMCGCCNSVAPPSGAVSRLGSSRFVLMGMLIFIGIITILTVSS